MSGNTAIAVSRITCHSAGMEKPQKTKRSFGHLDIYPKPELLEALDRWRGQQPGVPPRAAAARMLMEDGLIRAGVMTPRVSVVDASKGRTS
jgi:hypothetical protein